MPSADPSAFFPLKLQQRHISEPTELQSMHHLGKNQGCSKDRTRQSMGLTLNVSHVEIIALFTTTCNPPPPSADIKVPLEADCKVI